MYHNNYVVDPLVVLDTLNPLGYVPPAPALPEPPEPVYEYPIPAMYLYFRGKVEGAPWLNDWELITQTNRPNDLIEFVREGRRADGFEVARIRVQDWVG